MEKIILHTCLYEQMKELTHEQKGIILDAMFMYVAGFRIDINDREAKRIWLAVRSDLDQQITKAETLKRKRIEAGRKGLAKRWSNSNCYSKCYRNTDNQQHIANAIANAKNPIVVDNLNSLVDNLNSTCKENNNITTTIKGDSNCYSKCYEDTGNQEDIAIAIANAKDRNNTDNQQNIANAIANAMDEQYFSEYSSTTMRGQEIMVSFGINSTQLDDALTEVKALWKRLGKDKHTSRGDFDTHLRNTLNKWYENGKLAKIKQDSGNVTLGTGERIENGRRTYGGGFITVPMSAPPRPGSAFYWDQNRNSWEM